MSSIYYSVTESIEPMTLNAVSITKLPQNMIFFRLCSANSSADEYRSTAENLRNG